VSPAAPFRETRFVQGHERGHPPDLLPFIFDRFTQGDSSAARPHTGLGLGPSIVRHIVELHGGTVHDASEGPGRGATFSVHLPLHDDTQS
jgi:signal transduction histidine kinase